MIDAVLRREVEFGITVARSQHPELTTHPLLEDRFVLICREDHALARRKRLAWRKLEGHPLVFVGAESGNRPLLDAALAQEQPALHVHYEVQRSSTALGLVAAGVAAAVVPQLAIQRGAYPNVRVVPLVEPVVSRSLVLVTRAGAQLSPAAKALFELLLQR
jgi:DNA-binding transcriptional LysR family regulator